MCAWEGHDRMRKHRFTVVIEAATEDQAETVMNERLGYDEDYGFQYRLLRWHPQISPHLSASKTFGGNNDSTT